MMAVTFNSIDDSLTRSGARRRMASGGWSVGQGLKVIALGVAIAGVAVAGIGAGIAAGFVNLASQALR
jgi:hypothetical protein